MLSTGAGPIALASAGAGVALVPRSALRGVELTGVVVRPVDGVAPTRRVFAAVRRGAGEHPLIRPVLDALQAAAPIWPAAKPACCNSGISSRI